MFLIQSNKIKHKLLKGFRSGVCPTINTNAATLQDAEIQRDWHVKLGDGLVCRVATEIFVLHIEINARWTKLPTLLPPPPQVDLLTCEGNANCLQFKNNMFRITHVVCLLCFEGSESKSDDLNSSNLREKLGKNCSENQWLSCSLGCNHVLQLWLFKFKAKKKKKSNTRILYIYIQVIFNGI